MFNSCKLTNINKTKAKDENKLLNYKKVVIASNAAQGRSVKLNNNMVIAY